MDAETVQGISEAEQVLSLEQQILMLKLMLQAAEERCWTLGAINELNEAELGRRQAEIEELQLRNTVLVRELEELDGELATVPDYLRF